MGKQVWTLLETRLYNTGQVIQFSIATNSNWYRM